MGRVEGTLEKGADAPVWNGAARKKRAF